MFENCTFRAALEQSYLCETKRIACYGQGEWFLARCVTDRMIKRRWQKEIAAALKAQIILMPWFAWLMIGCLQGVKR
jgi:hypothetical protein